jgi:hypothetical protein
MCPNPSPEDGKKSSIRNVVFFKVLTMEKVQIRMIVKTIGMLQN